MADPPVEEKAAIERIHAVLTVATFTLSLLWIAYQTSYGWILLATVVVMFLLPLAIARHSQGHRGSRLSLSEATALGDHPKANEVTNLAVSGLTSDAEGCIKLDANRDAAAGKETMTPDAAALKAEDFSPMSPSKIRKLMEYHIPEEARMQIVVSESMKQHLKVLDVWLHSALELIKDSSVPFLVSPKYDAADVFSRKRAVQERILKRFPYLPMASFSSSGYIRCRSLLGQLKLKENDLEPAIAATKPTTWDAYELTAVDFGTLDENAFLEISHVSKAHPDLLLTVNAASDADDTNELLRNLPYKEICSKIYELLIESGCVHAQSGEVEPVTSTTLHETFAGAGAPWEIYSPLAELVLEQTQLFWQQRDKCSYRQAMWKYHCDRQMDEQALECSLSFKGLKACVYAHVRSGFGDLGAAVNNACFLRELGFTVKVLVGGNYEQIPPEILRKFEDTLGSRVQAISSLLPSDARAQLRESQQKSKCSPLNAHMFFDTYTRMAGDNDVIEEVMALFRDPKPQRFSLAEFGFSALQDWGLEDANPTEFSMGLGPLELGIPLSIALAERYVKDKNQISVEKMMKLKHADRRTYDALLYGVGRATDGEAELVQAVVDSHTIFVGYGHLPGTVINFILLSAALSVHEHNSEPGESAAFEDRDVAAPKHVDICLCSSRTTIDEVLDIVRYFSPQLLQKGWFDRIIVQTLSDENGSGDKDDRGCAINQTVVMENLPVQNGSRTLRVIRQGMKLSEVIGLSHPFGLCTGDSTLSEFVSARKVFIYDCLPHKQETLISLMRICHELKLPNLLSLVLGTYVEPYPTASVTDSIRKLGSIPERILNHEFSGVIRDVCLQRENEKLYDHISSRYNLAIRKQAKLNRMALLKQAESIANSGFNSAGRIKVILKSLVDLEFEIYGSEDDELYMSQCLTNYKHYLDALSKAINKALSGLGVIKKVYAIACADQWSQAWIRLRQAHLEYPGLRTKLNHS